MCNQSHPQPHGGGGVTYKWLVHYLKSWGPVWIPIPERIFPNLNSNSFHSVLQNHHIEKDQNSQIYPPLEQPMNRSASWQNQKNDCVLIEDSDQPGHPPSLIRDIAVRSMGRYPSCLHADREDPDQTDLSLRWVHRSFCWFCHEAAQFISQCSSKIIMLKRTKIPKSFIHH